MDIRVLRYFLAVAREENITKAANTLHISQPSLSKQLMDLEQELGKTLLLRGKRKVLLTEDGILLRKRAEEIILLLEKTEKELSADNSQISGEISIGGNPTSTLLKAAAQIRANNPNVQFQFYSSDATDVSERMDNGSLIFSVLLEPIDTIKYDYLSLPDSSRWGLLMPSDCALAQKDCIQKTDLTTVPLILHRRIGLQSLISRWAETEITQLNVAATYNVINGSPAKFVQSGLGYCLATEDFLLSSMEQGLCFRPLYPALDTHYALVWKKHTVFSKAAAIYLETLKN